MLRSIGGRLSGDPAAGDLIGQFSLAAVLLGTVAMVIAGPRPVRASRNTF
jgi:hypothetical protein